MKTSELIKLLEASLEENGDLPITVTYSGYGGHALHTVNTVKEGHITPYELQGDFDPDPDTWHELFPNESYPEDIYEYTGEVETKTIEISLGAMLYST